MKAPFREVLRNPELLRLNFGVFALHATQTALFVVLPHMLEAAACLSIRTGRSTCR